MKTAALCLLVCACSVRAAVPENQPPKPAPREAPSWAYEVPRMDLGGNGRFIEADAIAWFTDEADCIFFYGLVQVHCNLLGRAEVEKEKRGARITGIRSATADLCLNQRASLPQPAASHAGCVRRAP